MNATPVADVYDCAIAGGGPAGVMLALLLARAGRRVVVLEKHADFLRDFRGDTIHPSTLAVLDELGLSERLNELPIRYGSRFGFSSRLGSWTLADFSRLPGAHRHIAFVPQWDFLEMLVDAAKQYPGFTLLRCAEVKGVVRESGRVTGLSYLKHRINGDGGSGEERIARAKLSVAADGRHSTVCAAAGLVPEDLGAPIDVLWFRLPRAPGDPGGEVLGRLGERAMLVLIDRGDYWQIAYIIEKGAFAHFDDKALAALRDKLGILAPFLADRVDELRSRDQLHLLSVQLNRLRRWHQPGLLCIGDAAHAMSPVGGIGINLAIQDAVAAANRLAAPLAGAEVRESELAAVQRRRWFPTVATQKLQQSIHKLQLEPVFAGRPPRPALPVRLIAATPIGRGLAARLIGFGVLPEHVHVG